MLRVLVIGIFAFISGSTLVVQADHCSCFLGNSYYNPIREFKSGDLLNGSSYFHYETRCSQYYLNECANNCTRFMMKKLVVKIDKDAEPYIDLVTNLAGQDYSLGELLCQHNTDVGKDLLVSGISRYVCYRISGPRKVPVVKYTNTKLRSKSPLRC